MLVLGTSGPSSTLGIPTMSKSYEVVCYLCQGSDDIRRMKMFRGEYFHKVRIPGYSTTCIDAAKNKKKK